jgi:hypothetical protein
MDAKVKSHSISNAHNFQSNFIDMNTLSTTRKIRITKYTAVAFYSDCDSSLFSLGQRFFIQYHFRSDSSLHFLFSQAW